MNTTNFLTIFITITFLLVIKKNYAQEVRVIDNKGTIKKVRNNQVTTSATSPASPLEGDIWFDNSNTPTLIKIYDGSVWLDPSIEFYQQIVRTPGSIYFANTTGLPTEDNAQLFWDNTNNYLGIGTNSPNNKLDVLGAINTRGILNSNGTVSEPSFRFKNDTDTGIFRPNLVDEMGFSAGGVEAMHIEEDANTTLVTIKNTLALDGNLLDENDASGTAGQILSATATGTDWVSVKSTDSSISVTTDSNNNIDLSVTPSVVTAGTCTTVTGSGTSANPYVVTAIADVVSAVYTESSINYVDITKCTASGTVTIKVRVY